MVGNVACFRNQENPIFCWQGGRKWRLFSALEEKSSFLILKTSDLPPISHSLSFLHSTSFSFGLLLPSPHTYSKCSGEAPPFQGWGMRFRTDQSKHSFSLDPWTGSGLAQDLSQLNHSELHGFSSR